MIGGSKYLVLKLLLCVGMDVLRMLIGWATALPVEGERMSSPPPISVISWIAPARITVLQVKGYRYA